MLDFGDATSLLALSVAVRSTGGQQLDGYYMESVPGEADGLKEET